MTYDNLARFAQQAGSIYFLVLFSAGLIYALWPSNRARFSHAKQALLNDEEPGQ